MACEAFEQLREAWVTATRHGAVPGPKVNMHTLG